jgi:hypothetical protein
MVTVPETCNTGFLLMSLEEVYRGVVLKVFLQYDTSH